MGEGGGINSKKETARVGVKETDTDLADSNQRRRYGVKPYMSEPTFDIFSGTSDKDARWLESIEGLSRARGRMERLAEVRPGAYFLYDPLSHSILAKSDITKQLQFETQEK
jgi:hypothetical protein